MRMKNRVISILLAGVLALGLLAGCGAAAERGNGGESVRTDEAENAAADGAEGSTEVKSINMYTMGIGNTTDYKAVQNAINDISREKIGVEVNWTVLDIGQWFEQYNLLLSGSEPVDSLYGLGTGSGHEVPEFNVFRFRHFRFAQLRNRRRALSSIGRRCLYLSAGAGCFFLHLSSGNDMDLAEFLYRRRMAGGSAGNRGKDDGIQQERKKIRCHGFYL